MGTVTVERSIGRSGRNGGSAVKFDVEMRNVKVSTKEVLSTFFFAKKRRARAHLRSHLLLVLGTTPCARSYIRWDTSRS
jgi:hypothetical protein